jgi:hypothetical protein
VDRERFKSAWLKLDRAEEHLKTLQGELQSWLSDEPYNVVKKFDSESGRHSLVLETLKTAPFDWYSIVAGDCAHNARCALDHLVYALAAEGPNGLPDDLRKLQFPLCGSANDFLRERYRIAPLAQEAQDFIQSKQPYHGRHDVLPPILAVLKTFDDLDKHRLVHLTYDCNSGGRLSFTEKNNKIVSPTAWANKPLKNGDEFASFVSTDKSEVPYSFAVSFTIGVSHIPGATGRTVSPLESVMIGIVAEIKRILDEASGIGREGSV